MYLKQYGAQRTCTNYVKVLLEQNLQDVTVLASILGWKHGAHPEKIDWTGKSWGAAL